MTTAEERDQFDRILEEVIGRLPDDLHEMLEEIPVIVDDEPPAWLLKSMGITARKGESDLCGVHWGVPLPEKSVLESDLSAQQIRIFRGPIYRLSGRSKRSLFKQILITLLHELGHHYGLDEDRLAELGYD